jgi:hypothetical protein
MTGVAQIQPQATTGKQGAPNIVENTKRAEKRNMVQTSKNKRAKKASRV